MPATQPTPRQLRIALAFTATVLLAMLFLQLLDPEFNGDDFLAMYAAGSLVHQGHGAQLYDLQAQARMEAPLVKHQGLVLIVHPPFEAVAFAPFTALPFAAAYILWGVVNILLWLLFAHLARRFAPVPRQPFRYLLLCFGFLPLWLALMKGQTISLLIVLYCLTFLSLQKGHDFRAGAFLGLGLFRFQLVLPFALVCLLRKKWRMVAGFWRGRDTARSGFAPCRGAVRRAFLFSPAALCDQTSRHSGLSGHFPIGHGLSARAVQCIAGGEQRRKADPRRRGAGLLPANCVHRLALAAV